MEGVIIKSFLSNRNFSKGKDCFSNKDYKNAAEYFRKAAEDGHADAQFNLGILYIKGLGVPKNNEDALRWLGKAAGQGHTGAKKELGLIQSGDQGAKKGVGKNLELLREIIETSDEKTKIMMRLFSTQMGIPQGQDESAFIRKLAEDGDLDMQASIARSYQFGDQYRQNYEEALKWYTKLAAQEDRSAQCKVGEFFFMGYGTAINLAEAEKWWRKAAINGDENAQLYLNILSGKDTQREKPERDDGFDKMKILYSALGGERIGTLPWFREQAEKGIADYQYKLGVMYDEGTYISEDSIEAVKWYRKAAEQGHKEAQNNLGHAYTEGEGVEQDYGEAVKWFRKSADQGYPQAQFNLGMRYREGSGVEKNLTEAFMWMRKALEQGIESSEAQSLLGQAYFFGEGTAQNYHEAVKWFTKACEENDADAQFYLGWCYLSGNGVKRDIKIAEKLFSAAASNNEKHSSAIFRYLNSHNCSIGDIGMVVIRMPNKGGYDEQVMMRPGMKSEARLIGNKMDILPEISEDLSKIKKKTTKDSFEELFENGLKEKDAGNIDKSIVIWKKILEKDFRHLNAINAVACAYAESGKLDMAKKYIDMAMKVGGDQADFVRINLAGILYDSGKFEEAEEILNAIECKDGRMIDNLTRVLVAQGKSERALELIEEFLAKEGVSTTLDNDEDHSLQEIITRGVNCILECKPDGAIDFLETYAHFLPPEPLSSVYFNAGIHFLQDENDGVRALKCLSEAVRNKPDDSEMREALSDAALKVIAEFGGQGKISENDKATLCTAYEAIGSRQKALEMNKQIA